MARPFVQLSGENPAGRLLSLQTSIVVEAAAQAVWGTHLPLGDGTPLEVTLDDDALPIPAIETALRKGLDGKGMKEGAIAVLTAAPEYCEEAVTSGQYNLPAGATVEARIELLSLENISETWDLNANQRLEVRVA